MAHDGKQSVVEWLDEQTANLAPEQKAAVKAFVDDAYLGAAVRKALGKDGTPDRIREATNTIPWNEFGPIDGLYDTDPLLLALAAALASEHPVNNGVTNYDHGNSTEEPRED